MRDNYLPLINGTQTASTVGTPIDLLKGTNVEKDNRPGVDLLGAAGRHLVRDRFSNALVSEALHAVLSSVIPVRAGQGS